MTLENCSNKTRSDNSSEVSVAVALEHTEASIHAHLELLQTDEQRAEYLLGVMRHLGEQAVVHAGLEVPCESYNLVEAFQRVGAETKTRAVFGDRMKSK